MNTAWMAIFAALSAAPVLKIADVQAVEIAQVLWLVPAAAVFVYRGLPVPCGGIWRRYGSGYLVFLILCVAVSALALRLPFYAPPDISVLKQPGWLSLARIFELCLVIGFMLVVARTASVRPRLLRLGMDVYVWAGACGAALSIAGWLLKTTAGVSTFLVYGYEDRVRGFFNEGGPYGMYVLSVAVVALLRARVVPGGSAAAVIAPLAAALLLSGSKSGLLAAFGLGLFAIAVVGSRRRRIAMLGVSSVLMVAFVLLFQGRVYGYFWSYFNFDEALVYRPGDPSLIMGRIAAAIVVPRMIAAHPMLGIGAGNYSLMRNDPEYRQGLPPVDEWDLPGTGLLGTAAELGVPLTLFLIWLLLRPIGAARRRKAPAIVAVAAAFPAMAFLLGVNLNFFYPWLVGAFAIATESFQC